jgi:hypothetical protein
MIAVVKHPCLVPDWHAGFLAMLPGIARHVRRAFAHLTPAARQEAEAEAIAAALVAYRRLFQLGKAELAYVTPLSRYAVHHVRNDRHVGGSQSSRDVLSQLAQRKYGFLVAGLSDSDEATDDWKLVAVEDRTATPADTAALRCDFAAWLGTLSWRNRRLAEALAAGQSTQDAATAFHVSPGRISQLRSRLRDSWGRFQGELPAPQQARQKHLKKGGSDGNIDRRQLARRGGVCGLLRGQANRVSEGIQRRAAMAAATLVTPKRLTALGGWRRQTMISTK